MLTRIYFNAVFGALGGLLRWMLFSVFGQNVVVDKPVGRKSDRMSAQVLPVLPFWECYGKPEWVIR